MRCPLQRLVGRFTRNNCRSVKLNPKPVRRLCLAIRDRPIVRIQERGKLLGRYAPQPRLAANLQEPQNQPCPGTGVGPPVRLRTDTMFKATLRAVLLGLSVRIRVSRRPNDFSGFRISPRNRGLSGSKRRAPASVNDDPGTASARSRWQRSMTIRRVAVLRMRNETPSGLFALRSATTLSPSTHPDTVLDVQGEQSTGTRASIRKGLNAVRATYNTDSRGEFDG